MCLIRLADFPPLFSLQALSIEQRFVLVRAFTNSHRDLRSARRIQRFWRLSLPKTIFRLVQSIAQHGLSVAQLRARSFEQVTELIREPAVIEQFKQMLMRIHHTAHSLRPVVQTPPLPTTVNVREVIAGYLVVCFTDRVFVRLNGQQEQALLADARQLLTELEYITERITYDHRHSLQTMDGATAGIFLDRLFSYLQSFRAWKAVDAPLLTARIVAALRGLYSSMQLVPPADPIIAEFGMQITRLRNKLQAAAGEGALAEFAIVHADFVRISGVSAARVIDARTPSTRGLTNEELAHRLILDPEYLLSDSTFSTPGGGQLFRESSNAFWANALLEMNNNPPCYTMILRALVEVHTALTDIAPAHQRHAIAQIVDAAYIQQQTAMDLWTWDECKQTLENLARGVSSVQAWRRETSFHAGWVPLAEQLTAATDPAEQKQLICSVLAFLLERVNLSRIDAANVRLDLIRPVIRDQGIAYEQAKFMHRLAAGTVTLQKTRAWIRRTIAQPSVGQPERLAAVQQRQQWAIDFVLADAIVALVAVEQAPDAWPETLEFDEVELRMMHFEFDYLVRAAVATVTVRQVLATSQALTPAAMAEALTAVSGILVEMTLFAAVEPTAAIRREVADALTVFVPSAATAVMDTLAQTLARRLDAPEDPVCVVFRTRLSGFFHSAAAGVDMATLNVAGAELLMPRIAKVGRRFARIAEVHRQVQTSVFQLISEVADEAGAGGGAVTAPEA